MGRPNLIYLHSHDTGRYVQPYGYAVATPRLQAFAEGAVLFRNAYTVNPTCSPSRSALLTGQWPTRCGMLGLAHRGSRLSDPSRHLANLLSRQGYVTALAGVQHEAAWDERQTLGYTEVIAGDPNARTAEAKDEQMSGAAAAFLRERAKVVKGGPFFLSCGFFTTHRYGPAGRARDEDNLKPEHHNTQMEPMGDARYVRAPACLPDTPRTRADWADYVVAAGRLDGLMGRVIEAVDAAGLGKNTIVLVTTDHGVAFPGMKCNLTDHGTGVMMMLRGPGLERYAGRVVEPMVTHLDVLPTLLQLMGLPDPGGLDGRSMLPVISGEADALHDAVYGMVNFHAAYEPMRTVRTTRYRYIRRWETGTPTRVLPNCDDSLSKRELMEHGWAHRPPAREELFDLMLDPNEACNVAGEGGYSGVLSEMRERLAGWMEAIEDPLRAGRLEAPKGFVLNPVTQVSPSLEPEPAVG